MDLHSFFEQVPIMAILRGLQPHEAVDVGNVLYQVGIRVMEVPLNRPDAFDAMTQLIQHMPNDCLIGAGTVLTQYQVAQVKRLDGQFVVSPHSDAGLIESAVSHQLLPIPGFYTPSEALNAVGAGAKYLKLFPAGNHSSDYLKQVKTVLPQEVAVIPVGGITPGNLYTWLDAGAIAVGIGGELYRQGDTWREVSDNLNKFLLQLKP